MPPLWLTLAGSLAAALLLTPLARCAARRWNVVDVPDGLRKLQRRPVPYWGGVAVYVSLLIGIALSLILGHAAASPLLGFSGMIAAAAGIVCLAGAIDDSFNLRPRTKLLLQILGTVPIVAGGFYVEHIGLFGLRVDLGLWGIPLTVLWLVGCINALNLLDGMDGLAAVVGISSASMIALIAGSGHEPHAALVAVALAGALLGFLVYNLPPASIYLGDSGSMVIGLVVGVLAIHGSLKTSATLSITVPALIMTIPMLDTALAIVRRRLSGRSIGAGDRGHIHHRLLERGLTNWQALCIIGSLCLATGAIAAAVTIFRVEAVAWVLAISLVVLLVRLQVFGHHELALVKVATANLLSQLVHRLVEPRGRSAGFDASRLDGLSFSEAWQQWSEHLAALEVTHVELVARRDGSESIYRQGAPSVPIDRPEAVWNYGLTFPVPRSSDYCAVSVAGPVAASGSPLLLLQLAREVRAFGQYWADHLEEIPSTEKPQRIERETVALRKAA